MGCGPGEPLDNQTKCEAAVAAFEKVIGRSLLRPAPQLPSESLTPASESVEAAPRSDLAPERR